MKPTIRKELRRKRRAMGGAEHASRSKLAASFVTRLAAFKAGARIALYLPFDGEADTAALIAAARRRAVRIFVPVVVDVHHSRIRFYPFSDQLRRGTFGISIPKRNGRPLAARWFDLIVVPLVGLDVAGRRLGMGGGFYDRALAFRRARRIWMGPRLVGFAFDCQRVDSVSADPWDVRLDAVATESGLEVFKG